MFAIMIKYDELVVIFMRGSRDIPANLKNVNSNSVRAIFWERKGGPYEGGLAMLRKKT